MVAPKLFIVFKTHFFKVTGRTKIYSAFVFLIVDYLKLLKADLITSHCLREWKLEVIPLSELYFCF